MLPPVILFDDGADLKTKDSPTNNYRMLHIIAVTDSHSHFQGAIEEYIKRLGRDIEYRAVKPERSEHPDLIRRKESLRIREVIGKMRGLVVYCDIVAKPVSTEAFGVFVEKSKLAYPDIVFIVAGAYGIDEEILAPHIAHRVSFSPMTFPHSLALLVLLEQIYRIGQIAKNSGYHH